VNKVGRFPCKEAAFPCYKLGCSFAMLAAQMEPAPRPSFQPAGAGALLAGTTAAGIGVGALIGWAVGSTGLGVLGGAIAGVPAGVFAVYRRYRGFFT
jgi:F0F1-type ATP synthase assembly protein I